MITRLWKRFPAAAALFNMAGISLLAVEFARLIDWVQSGRLDPPVVGWVHFMLTLGLICGFAGVVAFIVQLLLERRTRRRVKK